VHVGMMHEGLAPGVEDGEEAQLSPEVAGVGGDVLKGRGRRAQEKVVDDSGVLEGEGREGLGQGEHDVGIGHLQHLGLAGLEPAGLGAALTLRAMAVAARVVGDRLLPAGVALIDMTTQPGRPAGKDPVHDRMLLSTPGRDGPGWELGIEVLLEDLRDLVPGSLGHLFQSRDLRAQGIQRTPCCPHPFRGNVRIDGRGP
jgi:hypothetical protein